MTSSPHSVQTDGEIILAALELLRDGSLTASMARNAPPAIEALTRLVEQLDALEAERLTWAQSAGSAQAMQAELQDRTDALQEQLESLRKTVRLIQKVNGELPDPQSYEAIESLCRDALNPAISPGIDGEELCPKCGAPRKQGCGCWLNDPQHPWASRAVRSPASEPEAT